MRANRILASTYTSAFRYSARMAHDPRAIANFLLKHAKDQRRPLTTMALLKIIYFAHGWHLARTGKPLIRSAFEAWEHGPVVRIVYDCFRKHGDDPIETFATRFDPDTGKRVVVPFALSDEEATLLRDVFKAYGWLDAFQLSEITHAPGSPWDRVWNSPDRKVIVGMRISDEAIRQHFLRSEQWVK